MYTSVDAPQSDLKTAQWGETAPERPLSPSYNTEEEQLKRDKISFDRQLFLQLQSLYRPENILFMKPVYLYSFDRFTETK